MVSKGYRLTFFTNHNKKNKMNMLKNLQNKILISGINRTKKIWNSTISKKFNIKLMIFCNNKDILKN